MAKYRELDTIFFALSDPTRRAILEQLMGGEKTVGQVAEQFESALPTVSRHIRALETAGLIERNVEGRTHYLSLQAAPLGDAVGYLAQYRRFWQEAFEMLDRYFDEGSTDDE